MHSYNLADTWYVCRLGTVPLVSRYGNKAVAAVSAAGRKAKPPSPPLPN